MHMACRDLEALATGNFKCNGVFLQTDVEVPACKEAMTSKEASRTGLRHIATEQRRRDRINEGCAINASVSSIVRHDCKPELSVSLSSRIAFIICTQLFRAQDLVAPGIPSIQD